MIQIGVHTLAAGMKAGSNFAAFPGAALPGNNAIPWTIVVTLTLLTLLPAIVLSITPMVRLLVVFHFLRQALGTQTAPGNQTLMGLGLMMTWFLMQPVLVAVNQQAVQPFRQGRISGARALERGVEPPKKFMLHYAREKDLALFALSRADFATEDGSRPADAGGGAGVHAVGAEGRLSDWRHPLSALPPGGHRRRLSHDLDRHVAAAARDYLDPAQNPAVRHGGWMASARWLAAQELLGMRVGDEGE